MLGQRRRRWANVKTTLFQCIVFAGVAENCKTKLTARFIDVESMWNRISFNLDTHCSICRPTFKLNQSKIYYTMTFCQTRLVNYLPTQVFNYMFLNDFFYCMHEKQRCTLICNSWLFIAIKILSIVLCPIGTIIKRHNQAKIIKKSVIFILSS